LCESELSSIGVTKRKPAERERERGKEGEGKGERAERRGGRKSSSGCFTIEHIATVCRAIRTSDHNNVKSKTFTISWAKTTSKLTVGTVGIAMTSPANNILLREREKKRKKKRKDFVDS